MKAGRWLTGWARLEIRGEHPERFLNELAERAVPFWQARPPQGHALQLSAPDRELARIRDMAAAGGFEAVVLRRFGWPCLGQKLLRRKLFLAVLGCMLLLLGCSRLFVWRVEIEGAGEELSRSEVRMALADCGVDVGAFWPAFSQDLIRNAMLLRLPELRWMTVNLQGCTARVILRTAYEAEAVVEEGQFVSIRAARAGLVTQVLALRGTAMVSEGETVLPGQVLIDGLASGRYNSHGALRAIGLVEAETWRELSLWAPAEREEILSREKVGSRWALILGKRRINFFKGGSICPAFCVKMTEEAVWAADGLFQLPVALVKETVWRCGTESRAAQQREALETLLYEELLAQLGDGGEVLESYFSCSEADGLVTVTLRARCREQIGRETVMSPEEIAAKSPVTEETDE